MKTELESFIEKRNKVLTNLDIQGAREIGVGGCDQVVIIAMHKARYECTQITPELRHASGEWLRANKYRRANGQKLLNEGELP